MIRWILILALLLPSICFAAPLQQAHIEVIAKMNISGGEPESCSLYTPFWDGGSFTLLTSCDSNTVYWYNGSMHFMHLED